MMVLAGDMLSLELNDFSESSLTIVPGRTLKIKVKQFDYILCRP